MTFYALMYVCVYFCCHIRLPLQKYYSRNNISNTIYYYIYVFIFRNSIFVVLLLGSAQIDGEREKLFSEDPEIILLFPFVTLRELYFCDFNCDL